MPSVASLSIFWVFTALKYLGTKYIPWYQAGPADFEQKSGGFCESAVNTRNPPDFEGPPDFMN
jgi:hypothetical protein